MSPFIVASISIAESGRGLASWRGPMIHASNSGAQCHLFEILTCYYRFAIQDTATGRAFLRLRAVLQ